METEEIKDNAVKKVRIMKMRKTNGTHKTIAAFDLCYDNAIVVHGLFLKKINGWFHIDFPSRQVSLGQEKEYLDTCRPATAEWRRAITEVAVAEWSKLFGAQGEEPSHERPNV